METGSTATGLAAQLQRLIYDTIPLGKATSLQVRKLDSNCAVIEAPVAGVNSNIHNTAFAGSIYSVCALSAWGLVHMRLHSDKIRAEVVLAQAEIRYRLPVNDRICATCIIEESEYEVFRSRLLKKGKASIAARVHVQENDEVQASLEARVVAIINPA